MRLFKNALAAGVLLVFGFGVLAQTQAYAHSHVSKAAPKRTVNIVSKSAGTFAFSPTSVTVKVGTRIVWKNETSAPHTVASVKSGVFNLGPFNKGQTASFVFKKKGTFKYLCGIHPYMTAKVIVK